MEKLGWTMLTSPHKLWVKIMTDKYLNKSIIFNFIPNSSQSPIWRDILKGRNYLQEGIKVGLGNGSSTSLWYNHWVRTAPLY